MPIPITSFIIQPRKVLAFISISVRVRAGPVRCGWCHIMAMRVQESWAALWCEGLVLFIIYKGKTSGLFHTNIFWLIKEWKSLLKLYTGTILPSMIFLSSRKTSVLIVCFVECPLKRCIPYIPTHFRKLYPDLLFLMLTLTSLLTGKIYCLTSSITMIKKKKKKK